MQVCVSDYIGMTYSLLNSLKMKNRVVKLNGTPSFNII